MPFSIEGHHTYKKAADVNAVARYISGDVTVSPDKVDVVLPYGASAVAKAVAALKPGESASFEPIVWAGSSLRCADRVVVTRDEVA